MQAQLQAALDEVSRALDITLPPLSADNDLTLEVDKTEIGIALNEAAEAVQFLTVIGIMPDADGPELGRLLLSANHLGGLTGGAAVGLDTEENLLTLNLRLPLAGLDGAVLAAAIETMVEVTESWCANLHLLAGIDRGAGAGADGGSWVRM